MPVLVPKVLQAEMGECRGFIILEVLNSKSYVDENRAGLENTLSDDDFAVRELLDQRGRQLLIVLLDVDAWYLEKFG